jgi:hypothetical protein
VHDDCVSLFDLLFLFCFAAAVITAVRIGYLAIRRRFRAGGRVFVRLTVCVAVYMLVLLGFSLFEPLREVPIGTPRCFDDWCITVEQATRQATIGTTRAAGTFCVLTLRVSSRAKRITQREPDVYLYLTDESERRIEISPAGQQALAKAGLAGESVSSFVAPGESFESRVAFDVPDNARHLAFVKASHAWFPVRLIIGEPGSWLHRPTIVPLQ